VRRILLALALTLVALPVHSQSDSDQAFKNVKDCTSHNPDTSIAGCTAVLKSIGAVTNRYAVYNNRGVSYDKKGLYDKAIALKPDNASFYLNRANALYAKKLVRKAIADYRRALKLAPDMKAARTALTGLGVRM